MYLCCRVEDEGKAKANNTVNNKAANDEAKKRISYLKGLTTWWELENEVLAIHLTVSSLLSPASSGLSFNLIEDQLAE